MILVDTGPLVALFDPKDADHELCRRTLGTLPGVLLTTTPVLTEAFHLLGPRSLGSANLRRFLGARGLAMSFLDEATFARALALMKEHASRAMDLADASLVATAEARRSRTIFTLDRRDFRAYRARFGYRREALHVVP
jgi:predicted nucleic acid-binding protein